MPQNDIFAAAMYLIKSGASRVTLRKSQMSLFDWQPPKHEEERTVHASTRHLASGAVVNVQEHQRKIEVAEEKPKHEATSLKHTDENYRYREIGHVPGSRKELAAEQAVFIKQRAKNGQGLGIDDINFDALEENKREAYDLITKDAISKEIDWQAAKDNGVDPGAAFLQYKLYAAVAPRPEDNADARKDFVFGINALQDRFSDCKTVEDTINKIKEIREEMTGFTMNPEQQKTWEALDSWYQQAAKGFRNLDKEGQVSWDAYYEPSQRLQRLKYEQEARTRRGWKPDPELAERISTMQKDVDRLQAENMAWREANSKRLDELKKLSTEAWKSREAFKDKVIAHNIIEHPLTRGWNSFGKKFYNAINYSSYKGSDSFATHVATAKTGKVKDWNWLEKNKQPRAQGEASVRFEMRVAEKAERKGGKPLPKSDYGTADLKEAFNLANVQQGNWVLTDLNAAKHHTEQCAMAFQDMSELLDIDPKDISMNGRLSIAFGARGSGGHFGPGASAHYEPKHQVINLTKMKGGGCLAHEWFHFADDISAQVESGAHESGLHFPATERTEAAKTKVMQAFKDLVFEMRDGNHNESVQLTKTITEAERDHWLKQIDQRRKFGFRGSRVIQNIVEAPDLSVAMEGIHNEYLRGSFGAVKGNKALKQKELHQQIAVAHHAGTEGTYSVAGFNKGSKYYVECQKIDAQEKRKSDYWSSKEEMAARAFAAYVSDKLHESGRENTYLASYADNKYYVLDDIKPYPEGEERKRINAAFDKLFSTIKEHNTLKKARQSFYAPGLYLIKSHIGGTHGINRRAEIRKEGRNAEAGTGSSRRNGQEGRREGEIRKSEKAHADQSRERATAPAGREGFRTSADRIVAAAMYLLKSGQGSVTLRKSQMSFDFSGHDHHVAYTRINDRGTVSHIAAKGTPHHSAPPPLPTQHKQEVKAMARKEVEVSRNNVTVAEFFAAIKSACSKKGMECNIDRKEFENPTQTSNDSYFVRDGIKHARYGDKEPQRQYDGSDAPAKAETSRVKPYDYQTYILNHDGSAFNEICEFTFDNGQRGSGYYYQLNRPAPEQPKQVAPKLTLPKAYPNNAEGWKDYITKELDKSATTEEEKRTGDDNAHLVYDADSLDPKAGAVIGKMLQTGDYQDHVTYNDDGTATVEMWYTPRGEMKRLAEVMREERETKGNSETLSKVESAYMAAYDNAGDSMGGKDRPWHEEIYGDRESNPTYHSIALGSLSMTGYFDENQDVRDWYHKHGYRW